jgi:hypothetical protein
MLLAAVGSKTGIEWTLDGAPRLILVVLFGGATLMLLATWIMWLLGVGRFKPKDDAAVSAGGPLNGSQRGPWQWLQWFVSEIIFEFRNFLALVIMAVFVLALVLMLWPGLGKGDAESYTQMKDGLQVVVASLGGLVGSIIGYYFGESAVANAKSKKSGDPPTPTQALPPPDLGKDGKKVEPTATEGISKAKEPPKIG